MLEKTYDPARIEAHWADFWETHHCFTPPVEASEREDATRDTGAPYCIMLPPPNVTGSLHMGHAFQQTLMDILIRVHRMQGRQTLWQPGTDHAGIATQMLVERQLVAAGQTRQALGRDAFIEQVWRWKAQSGHTITQQMRRLGVSVDWTRERFTLDPGLSEAVQTVFIRLFEEGLIYRGKRLVNWDPVLLTAVSDLEVETHEKPGFLWTIDYPIVGRQDVISVATTRPETLFGDVAVAVHPEDERYRAWIGQSVRLPLTDRTLPIIADDKILPDFGTGCVKITPAHDFNDYAIGQRHGLPAPNIFTLDAKLNDTVPLPYQGLDRFVAREKVVQALTEQGLLKKTEPYVIKLPHGDRSGAILEPRLTDQWFVKMAPLAAPAIQAVEQGNIRFVPEQWQKTYFEWMHHIQDWCISRQLWWGHRIPAWYDEQGTVYVAKTEADVRQRYGLSEDCPLRQEDDVLDTWFSSALWPFSTLGWPEPTDAFQRFYPTHVLVTGFDIIFFWVARMIMFGLKFTNAIPFHTVYINGLIQDQDGQKMSKTKGNVLDPIDLIDGITLEALLEKRRTGLMQPQLAKRIEDTTRTQFPNGIPAFGTDALRFTFCALATPNRYIRFDFGRMEGYRNFCNKLWNAAKFVSLPRNGGGGGNTIGDRWIRSRWQATKRAVLQHWEQYRFDLAAQELYEFTWHEYCDWYLEASKIALAVPNTECTQKTHHNTTQYTLAAILEELLRMLHPIIPFITEELWQTINSLLNNPGDKPIPINTPGTTIMLKPYPDVVEADCDPVAEADMAWIKAIVLAVRGIRGEMTIAPNVRLTLWVYHSGAEDRARFTEHQAILQGLAKLAAIQYCTPDVPRPPSATAVVGPLELVVPLADAVDLKLETARLQKEITKLELALVHAKTKLDNPNYVAKAPAAVVEEERSRLRETERALQALQVQLQTLTSSA